MATFRPSIPRTLGLGLLVASTACYSYAPAALSGLRVGQDARINLTQYARSDLQSALGGYAVAVSGKIIARDSAGLVVAVKEVDRGAATPDILSGEHIRIPADMVATATVKQVSVPKTALLGGAIAGAAILVVGGMGSSDSPSY